MYVVKSIYPNPALICITVIVTWTIHPQSYHNTISLLTFCHILDHTHSALSITNSTFFTFSLLTLKVDSSKDNYLAKMNPCVVFVMNNWTEVSQVIIMSSLLWGWRAAERRRKRRRDKEHLTVCHVHSCSHYVCALFRVLQS